jgi:hypothetical protein
VKERADIKHDRLYYLYFREKPDKSLAYNSQANEAIDGNEEQKIGGIPSGAVSLIDYSNFNYSLRFQRSGISIIKPVLALGMPVAKILGKALPLTFSHVSRHSKSHFLTN